MSDAAGQLRAVEKHRERALNGAAALRDSVNDRAVLLGDLIPAGDGREPCHVGSFRLGWSAGKDTIAASRRKGEPTDDRVAPTHPRRLINTRCCIWSATWSGFSMRWGQNRPLSPATTGVPR